MLGASSGSALTDRTAAARPSRLVLGAGIGAAVGMLAYYFTGYQDDYCRNPDMIPCEPVFVIAGASGAGIGALIAHLTR